MKEITKKAHSVGAMVGFNLAHGAGNLLMNLHDWNVDFAVWCSYKYLNSGPGGLAGAFIHENHLGKIDIPRFEGWWGTNKETRFKMGPDFDPIPTAEAWQLSNPPIFQLASLRSSMSLLIRPQCQRSERKVTISPPTLNISFKRIVQMFVKLLHQLCKKENKRGARCFV